MNRPPFSSRLGADLETNPLSLALAARRASGETILDLTETNPTRAGLRADPSPLHEALAASEVAGYEPSAAGSRVAREAVARYYAERGNEIDPESLVLTASTSEGYAFTLKLLLDPGDELLVPRPSYPLFEVLTSLESVSLAGYPLRYAGGSGWTLDVDAVWGSVTPRTRALVVVSPNNPTGSFVKPEEWRRLAAGCAERGIAVIADEVFHDHRSPAFTGDAAELTGSGPGLTLVLNGLSKVAGLPQMKLGWMLVTGPEALRREALHRLEFIADAYLSVSAPVQGAAARLLAMRHVFRTAVRERVATNEATLRGVLGPSAVRVREGGWSAVVDLPSGRDDETLVRDLVVQQGVLVHPGYFYEFEEDGVLVVSLLPEPGIFVQGARRVADLLREKA